MLAGWFRELNGPWVWIPNIHANGIPTNIRMRILSNETGAAEGFAIQPPMLNLWALLRYYCSSLSLFCYRFGATEMRQG